MRQFENWLLYKISELYKINIIILIMSHANWNMDDYLSGCQNQNRLAMIRIENPCSQFAVLQ